jgi:hypothetical protein
MFKNIRKGGKEGRKDATGQQIRGLHLKGLLSSTVEGFRNGLKVRQPHIVLSPSLSSFTSGFKVSAERTGKAGTKIKASRATINDINNSVTIISVS